MAKTKISEFSSTAGDNTDINNINIAEGCSPANMNNSIRSLMAQLKDQQAGLAGDSFTVGGNLAVTGTTTLTGIPTAPTQSSSDDSTKIATTAFVTTKLSTLGTMSTQNASAVAITGGTITGITDLAVADGGTGASTLTANSVLVGNGTSAVQLVAPSTSGNVLTSNGTTWTSAPAGGIGIGQTWQDVTGSRGSGTTYTNNTGKPIVFFVSTIYTTSNLLSLVVGGVTVATADTTAQSNSTANLQAIVPNGSTYSATSNRSIASWVELR